MKQLIHNPLAVLGAYYFVSALISGMPAPVNTDGKGYRWLYSTLHIFAGNFGNIAAQWKNGGNPFGPVLTQDQVSIRNRFAQQSVGALRQSDPGQNQSGSGGKYTV